MAGRTTFLIVQGMERRIGRNKCDLLKNTLFLQSKLYLMQTTATTIRKTNTTTYRTKKKVYPETLQGCFSFEEFQDLLNEKIKEHYEKV